MGSEMCIRDSPGTCTPRVSRTSDTFRNLLALVLLPDAQTGIRRRSRFSIGCPRHPRIYCTQSVHGIRAFCSTGSVFCGNTVDLPESGSIALGAVLCAPPDLSMPAACVHTSCSRLPAALSVQYCFHAHRCIPTIFLHSRFSSYRFF